MAKKKQKQIKVTLVRSPIGFQPKSRRLGVSGFLSGSRVEEVIEQRVALPMAQASGIDMILAAILMLVGLVVAQAVLALVAPVPGGGARDRLGGLLLVAIAALAKTLTLAIERFGRGRLFGAIGSHPLLSMATGAGITAIVQSSSTTTSLMVQIPTNPTKQIGSMVLGLG